MITKTTNLDSQYMELFEEIVVYNTIKTHSESILKVYEQMYRNTLNSYILNYYYESEIGFETAALFKKILNYRMSLIMNKYNVMYQAQKELLSKDLLRNVDLNDHCH